LGRGGEGFRKEEGNLSKKGGLGSIGLGLHEEVMGGGKKVCERGSFKKARKCENRHKIKGGVPGKGRFQGGEAGSRRGALNIKGGNAIRLYDKGADGEGRGGGGVETQGKTRMWGGQVLKMVER